MSDEGLKNREHLLQPDETIVIPEKEKGLSFDKANDEDACIQNDIDAILKALG